jgi:hypothetical protein
MLPLGCHLLIEDIFDIVGAKGLMPHGPLHGVQQGLGTIVVLERQELLDLLCQRRVGGGQVLKISLGDVP